MKKRIVLIVLCLVLALGLSACGDKAPTGWEGADYTADTTVGSGAITLYVDFVKDDETVKITVCTDAATLGDALLEHGLIAGDVSAYGLYVTEANGITADYDKDGAYWGFYSNGEYLMQGVDATDIADGQHYEIVYTK